MHSDQDDRAEQRALTSSFRLAAVAVLSAVLTATLVIGAGQAWIAHRAAMTASTASPISRSQTVTTPVQSDIATDTPTLVRIAG